MREPFLVTKHQKTKNWPVPGWQFLPLGLLICSNKRWESFPSCKQEGFFPFKTFFSPNYYDSGYHNCPDTQIFSDLFPLPYLYRRCGLVRVGFSSWGVVATSVLSLPKTNDLWMAPFPFCRPKKRLLELSQSVPFLSNIGSNYCVASSKDSR